MVHNDALGYLDIFPRPRLNDKKTRKKEGHSRVAESAYISACLPPREWTSNPQWLSHLTARGRPASKLNALEISGRPFASWLLIFQDSAHP
jgi:hypothetical protein